MGMPAPPQSHSVHATAYTISSEWSTKQQHKAGHRLDDLRASFNKDTLQLLDRDFDGHLSMAEAAQAMQALGLTPNTRVGS